MSFEEIRFPVCSAHARRVAEMILDSVFETETVRYYPDIEQMLLDCAQGNC
jgi:hypothetical protein